MRLRTLILAMIIVLLVACATVQVVLSPVSTLIPGLSEEPAAMTPAAPEVEAASQDVETPQAQAAPQEAGPPTEEEPPVEEPQEGESPAEEAAPDATPTAYVLHLPHAASAPLGPGETWRLAHRVRQEELADLNFNLYAEAPAIEPEGAAAAIHFNRTVQHLVDAQLEGTKNSLGGTPIEGPGGFEQTRYLVASAAGWELGYKSSLYFEGSREMGGEQAELLAGRRVVSILFESTSYTGGAHPFTTHAALNFDLTAHRPLELAELFRAETGYLEIIAGYCTEQLRQRPEIGFEGFEDNAAPREENYRVWSITPHGLLITFEEYQVAPYASGAQQVLVPYAVLEAALDPDGPLGELATD